MKGLMPLKNRFCCSLMEEQEDYISIDSGPFAFPSGTEVADMTCLAFNSCFNKISFIYNMLN